MGRRRRPEQARVDFQSGWRFGAVASHLDEPLRGKGCGGARGCDASTLRRLLKCSSLARRGLRAPGASVKGFTTRLAFTLPQVASAGGAKFDTAFVSYSMSLACSSVRDCPYSICFPRPSLFPACVGVVSGGHRSVHARWASGKHLSVVPLCERRVHLDGMWASVSVPRVAVQEREDWISTVWVGGASMQGSVCVCVC